MKTKLFLTLIIAALLGVSSCGEKQKKEVERLSQINDSLKSVVIEKDTFSLTYVRAFNEIQDNLDSIKQMERMISESSAGNVESRRNMADDINRDIDAIYQLLLKNRQIVDNLRRQISDSGKSNKELEKMIARLSYQIESKDIEISLLREDLENKQIEIADLERNLAKVERQSRDQAAKLKAKTDEMNQAWYVIGNKKFLEENGIVMKTGGFIGIGASRKVADEFDKSLFTQIDLREVDALPVFSKKAELLTIHPAASYELMGYKFVDSLLIRHPDDFWSASKFLVVVID
jgi:hypothetical protein